MSARMLSSSRPARSAASSQRCSSSRSRAWCSTDAAASVLATNVPRPWRAVDETLTLQLAVGLRHRVRVDGELGHDLAHRRELVAHVDDAEPQRILHLLHDLQVGRDARVRVEVKLDHRP